MKARLLKKLRRKFPLWYCKDRNRYNFCDGNHIYAFGHFRTAKLFQIGYILEYARSNFKAFSKKASQEYLKNMQYELEYRF